MPSKSEKQRRFFGLVRAIQKGQVKSGYASKAAKKVAKEVTSKQAKDFAKKSK